jgi:hypothetical protein
MPITRIRAKALENKKEPAKGHGWNWHHKIFNIFSVNVLVPNCFCLNGSRKVDKEREFDY